MAPASLPRHLSDTCPIPVHPCAVCSPDSVCPSVARQPPANVKPRFSFNQVSTDCSGACETWLLAPSRPGTGVSATSPHRRRALHGVSFQLVLQRLHPRLVMLSRDPDRCVAEQPGKKGANSSFNSSYRLSQKSPIALRGRAAHLLQASPGWPDWS